jgi:MoaD family protein
MLKVKIEYLGHVKKMVGDKRVEEVEIKDNAMVADLLTVLSEKYGEPFKKAIYEPKAADVKSNFIVTVNGYLLNQLDGVQTKLKNRDHVVLMPIVSGG